MKVRRQEKNLCVCRSLSNENETLPVEQVEENTIETAEADDAIEVEKKLYLNQ
ncbi:MAG: hypothetical protein CM15mP85_31280 [Rhodobacterales bacterium]|nr:MAG: hypothetical protein CM15mP85_31280 [Rhodobacterales bacterium]